ncbi:MAG: DUF4417 domain-containing protein [Clostridia bacterium]|nr:DUF4417 domain-containing protein [Clostridia bacterium]
MFLRNQFKGVGMFHLPLVKKQPIKLDSVALLGYDKLSEDETEKIVHSFLDDNKFGSIYNATEEKVETLKRFKAVLTPDFSMYTEMPTALQLYNCFRNRWVGAFLQSKGVRVIPTVRWGDLESFNYCFDGVEKGSIVAVSTVGLKSDKANFMLGYNEMLRRIHPEAVICYGKPFEEMKGKIIAVDYAETNNLSKSGCTPIVCGHPESIFIPKGGGSAGGASSGNPKPKWEPKKEEDKRFLGEPGEIKETYNKKGERQLTKIGKDGYAERERHYSDHNKPHKHSNPHDHTFDWSEGHPNPSSPINYSDGNIPKFKILDKGKCLMKTSENNIIGSDKFESVDEFKYSLLWGREIIIEWAGIEYTILKEGDNDDAFTICEAYKPETEKVFKKVDELLDFTLETGEVLKDIVTRAEVIWRML